MNEKFLAGAVRNLVPNESFIIVDGVVEFKNKNITLPSFDLIEAKIAELEAKAKVTDTQKILMKLCDRKQQQVQEMILGYKATPLQIERYKDKYERAKAGEFDSATNELIITKYEEYLGVIRKLVDLIEYFRSGVDDLIAAGEIDRANELIEQAENFGADTTLEEIQGLLA